LHTDYVCGLCHMPSRAGKTKKSKDADADAARLLLAA
jgi:flagellar transcriptional activator FlhC